jgi:hypothetical protein
MLTTPAWLLVGATRNVPGVLSYDDRRLRFASSDALVFDVAAGEVEEVKWPKLWMGGGCKVKASGEEYRISFVKPNGAADITDELLGDATGILGGLGAAADLKEALGSFGDVKRGREAGKAWKEVLAGVST